MPSVVHHAAVSAPVQIHITLHSAPQKDQREDCKHLDASDDPIEPLHAEAQSGGGHPLGDREELGEQTAHAHAARQVEALRLAFGRYFGCPVATGFGRIAAFYYRSSTLYQIY